MAGWIKVVAKALRKIKYGFGALALGAAIGAASSAAAQTPALGQDRSLSLKLPTKRLVLKMAAVTRDVRDGLHETGHGSHVSHSSHVSHASHASHYSHYSSW